MAYSMCITQSMPAGLTGNVAQIDYIAACVACAGLKVSDRCQTVILKASKINLPRIFWSCVKIAIEQVFNL